MKWRIYLFMALAVLVNATAFAKDDNPEDYHMRGILFDGTEVEGYNETNFNNFIHPWVTEVILTDTYKGETKKYSSEELKAVWFTKVGCDSIPKIYESVRAQKRMSSIWNKKPKAYKKPVFLRLIYNGENVKGYIRPMTDFTHSQTTSIRTNTYMFYYLTKDSNVAVAYWYDSGDFIPAMRKVMKFYFHEFPELVEMVENKELTPKEFRSNPTIVLPLMDKFYKPKE